MSRSGQMPSDYGGHWTPEVRWDEYGPCGCGADAGKPCRDRRMKHVPDRDMWTPHPERQFFGWPTAELNTLRALAPHDRERP
jgi:hypothetical protein